MLLLGGIKFLLHEQGMTIKAVQNLLKVEGVAHVQSFSPAIESAAQHADPPPKAAQETAATPTENVVDLQFDPIKLSQSVVLSEQLERDDDGTQLLLFPELADEVPSSSVPPRTKRSRPKRSRAISFAAASRIACSRSS